MTYAGVLRLVVPHLMKLSHHFVKWLLVSTMRLQSTNALHSTDHILKLLQCCHFHFLDDATLPDNNNGLINISL
jgi:hypothetical protein